MSRYDNPPCHGMIFNLDSEKCMNCPWGMSCRDKFLGKKTKEEIEEEKAKEHEDHESGYADD